MLFLLNSVDFYLLNIYGFKKVIIAVTFSFDKSNHFIGVKTKHDMSIAYLMVNESHLTKMKTLIKFVK